MSLFSCIYAQSQDLCASALLEANMPFIFADDPSDCRAYLWCNYQGNNLVSVHQGRCEVGNFNAINMACDPTLLCTDRCQFVDPATKIRV